MDFKNVQAQAQQYLTKIDAVSRNSATGPTSRPTPLDQCMGSDTNKEQRTPTIVRGQ